METWSPKDPKQAPYDIISNCKCEIHDWYMIGVLSINLIVCCTRALKVVAVIEAKPAALVFIRKVRPPVDELCMYPFPGGYELFGRTRLSVLTAAR